MEEGMVFSELVALLKSMPGETKEIVLGIDDDECLSVTLRSTGVDGVGTSIYTTTTGFLGAAKNADEYMLRHLNVCADELHACGNFSCRGMT